MPKKFTKANIRGNEQAIEDLKQLDRDLRHGRGATPTNIRRQKRQIYEHLSKQGIPIGDVINNNIRREDDPRRFKQN